MVAYARGTYDLAISGGNAIGCFPILSLADAFARWWSPQGGIGGRRLAAAAGGAARGGDRAAPLPGRPADRRGPGGPPRRAPAFVFTDARGARPGDPLLRRLLPGRAGALRAGRPRRRERHLGPSGGRARSPSRPGSTCTFSCSSWPLRSRWRSSSSGGPRAAAFCRRRRAPALLRRGRAGPAAFLPDVARLDRALRLQPAPQAAGRRNREHRRHPDLRHGAGLRAEAGDLSAGRRAAGGLARLLPAFRDPRLAALRRRSAPPVAPLAERGADLPALLLLPLLPIALFPTSAGSTSAPAG